MLIFTASPLHQQLIISLLITDGLTSQMDQQLAPKAMRQQPLSTIFGVSYQGKVCACCSDQLVMEANSLFGWGVWVAHGGFNVECRLYSLEILYQVLLIYYQVHWVLSNKVHLAITATYLNELNTILQ